MEILAAILTIVGVGLGLCWLVNILDGWIKECEDAGIVNRGYVGEDSHGEGKTDL